MFPVVGREVCILPVLGRVPPVWPNPRSPEGFVVGTLPALTPLLAP
jgi:hypothetical protein